MGRKTLLIALLGLTILAATPSRAMAQACGAIIDAQIAQMRDDAERWISEMSMIRQRVEAQLAEFDEGASGRLVPLPRPQDPEIGPNIPFVGRETLNNAPDWGSLVGGDQDPHSQLRRLLVQRVAYATDAYARALQQVSDLRTETEHNQCLQRLSGTVVDLERTSPNLAEFESTTAAAQPEMASARVFTSGCGDSETTADGLQALADLASAFCARVETVEQTLVTLDDAVAEFETGLGTIRAVTMQSAVLVWHQNAYPFLESVSTVRRQECADWLSVVQSAVGTIRAMGRDGNDACDDRDAFEDQVFMAMRYLLGFEQLMQTVRGELFQRPQVQTVVAPHGPLQTAIGVDLQLRGSAIEHAHSTLKLIHEEFTEVLGSP